MKTKMMLIVRFCMDGIKLTWWHNRKTHQTVIYTSLTYGDFVLSGQIGPFTQQLALRQGENAGRLPDQHRVVQLSVPRGWRN